MSCAVILNLRLDDGLRLDLFWRIEDGRALAVFAWRCGIDAIGRGSVGRFVFGWFAKNLWQRLVHGDRIGRVGEGNLRLLFDNISDTESIGIMNDFGVRQRDRGAVIAVVSGGVLTVLGALTDPNYTVASTSPGAWTVSAAAASVGPIPTLTTVAGVLPETGGFTTLNGLVPGATPQIGLLRLISLAQTPDQTAPACASSSVGCPGAPYPTNLQVGPGIRFVASK